jgi:hypothetical protein
VIRFQNHGTWYLCSEWFNSDQDAAIQKVMDPTQGKKKLNKKEMLQFFGITVYIN